MVCLYILWTLFKCSKPDVIFKYKQIKTEQPHLTAPCSHALLEDTKRKSGKHFPAYVTQGLHFISMNELTAHWSKWDRTPFLEHDGSFLCISTKTADLVHLKFWTRDYLNWLTAEILTFFSSCDGKFNVHDLAERLLFSKSSHLPPTNPGWRLQSHSLARDYFQDDILSRPSSAVSLGECRRCSGQLSPVSRWAVRCVQCHTNYTFPVFTFHSFLASFSLFSYCFGWSSFIFIYAYKHIQMCK